jgi:hypothetical protein
LFSEHLVPYQSQWSTIRKLAHVGKNHASSLILTSSKTFARSAIFFYLSDINAIDSAGKVKCGKAQVITILFFM